MHRTRRYFALLAIVILCVLTVFPTPVSAKAKLRLSAPERIWVNGSNTFTVSYKGHSDETIKVTAKPKKAVKIKTSKWKDDTCDVTVTALKTKNVTLTVSVGGEEVTVNAAVQKAKKMSGEGAFEKLYGTTVKIESEDRKKQVYVGSGFFIGDGLILTNYHNVDSASCITITGSNGDVYEIEKIYKADVSKDIILFKVSGKNPDALTLAASCKGGETVYSMGNPGGIPFSFTQGTVGNPYPKMNDGFIQVMMPTGIGSGGSPIVNAKGQLIGMTTRTVNDSQEMVLAISYSDIQQFLDSVNEADYKSLEDLYALTSYKTKQSNDYQIFDTYLKDKVTKKTSKEVSATDIYEQVYPAMVDIIMTYNTAGDMNAGSGFFVGEHIVVSNHHVAAKSKKYVSLNVIDYYGNEYEVTDVKSDEYMDIAVLTVRPKNTDVIHGVLKISDYIPAGGEKVYAFGSPSGYSACISEGTIVMPIRVVEDMMYINFSAQISGGSSGGALLNKYGEVIGISVRTINVVERSNLAIPISYIIDFIS